MLQHAIDIYLAQYGHDATGGLLLCCCVKVPVVCMQFTVFTILKKTLFFRFSKTVTKVPTQLYYPTKKKTVIYM